MGNCEVCGTAVPAAIAPVAAAPGPRPQVSALGGLGQALQQSHQTPSVRVDGIPPKMSGENLLMILSGMFGTTSSIQFGLDNRTDNLYAVVEFKKIESATTATQTASIQFGTEELHI